MVNDDVGAERDGQSGAAPLPAPAAEPEAAAEKPVRPVRRSRPRTRKTQALQVSDGNGEDVAPIAQAASPDAPSDAALPVTVEPAAPVAAAESETGQTTTNGRSPSQGRNRGSRRSRKGRPMGETRPATQAKADEAEQRVEVPVASDAEEVATRGERQETRRGGQHRAAASPEPTRARIAVRKGLPEIVVGEETLTPAMLFGNVTASGASRRVHSQGVKAAEKGVRLLSTLLELVCPMPPDDSVYETLDERMELLLSVGHDVYVIPRIVFVPAPMWREQYPMEMQAYERGRGEDPSIASDHFWDEAGRSLRLLIEHARRTSYGKRIVGFHLERGEWFQPADAGFDRSYANREGFRRWLRRKYDDNEVALRAAWYDGRAQFYTAEIPPVPQPMQHTAFFDPRRERPWIDFMEYTSEMTAERIMSLARVVKEATENRALVSACYGYTWEFSHPWSGHLALRRLLDCADIDMLTGPISYTERRPEESGALPGPADSIALHGKLWMIEDDTKTHLAKPSSGIDTFNPRMENRSATQAVHMRTIGTALAHQLGIAWMDLWGEGWLDSDDIWKTLGWFSETASRQIKTRRRVSPQVVALLDEASLCHFNGGEGLMQRMLEADRDSLCRCGASVGVYLQSDVTHRDFPTDARLYLFLNPYRLPEDQREAIRDKLCGGGRTLAWFYTAGTLTERSALEEPTPDVVGLNLRPQPWNSEIGTRIVEPGHAIVQNLPGNQLGTRMRLNPSYYVDDDSPGITVLGEYEQSGLPSLVARSYNGGTSVFCGEPILTPDLLRGLCRHAGVHLYTRQPEDYVQAGYGWLSMHVLRDGYRTLMLPEGTIACDVEDGVASPAGSREYRRPVRARQTYLFYIGSPDAARRLGLEMRKPPAPSPQPSMPPPPPLPFVETVEGEGYEPEPGGVITDGSVEAERRGIGEKPSIETPLAQEGEVAEMEEAETGEETDLQTSAASKRRRRRGGRGRGRRRKPAASTDGDAGEPESSSGAEA